VLGRGFTKKDGLVYLTKGNFCLIYSTYLDYLFYLKRRSFDDRLYYQTTIFTLALFRIWKALGTEGFVDYLKVCFYVLNSFLGGKILPNTEGQKVLVKLSNGLPYVIPPHFRRMIREGNLDYIHITSSIFYSYKAIGLTYGSPDLTSITQPPITGLEETPVFQDFWMFVPRYLSRNFIREDDKLSDFSCTEITGMSAGPNGNPSTLFRRADYYFLRRHNPQVFNSLIKFCQSIQHHFFLTEIQSYSYRQLYELACDRNAKWEFSKEAYIGRLCTKYEAAGKIRIFAIGDFWSQWGLKPLHDYMVTILKRINQDATFDQDGSLDRFVKNNIGKRFWSFDLKSATDTIPKQLYFPILSALVGDQAAVAWFDIMDRPFRLPKEIFDRLEKGQETTVRYGRGQPMGLLSSWTSLAILHHTLVAYAYNRATGRMRVPDNYYVVLGDDIAIADEQLAMEYLAVCKEFHIELSIPKSYTDTTIVNFASRIISNDGTDYSPVSLKEIVRATKLDRKAELAYRLQRRGFIQVGLNNLFRAFFVRRTWLQESPLLVKGTFSSYGMRVYRVLLQPTGHNSLTLLNYILGLTPNLSLSTVPGMDIELTDKAITGFYILNDLPAKLQLPYIFVTKLNSFLDKKIEEWRNSIKINYDYIPFQKVSYKRRLPYMGVVNDITGNPETADFHSILTQYRSQPVNEVELLNRQGLRAFDLEMSFLAHSETMRTAIDALRNDINNLRLMKGKTVAEFITEKFKVVMRLPKLYAPFSEKQVWEAKKSAQVKDQLMAFGKFSLYERILARELLRSFLPEIPGLTSPPFASFGHRRKRRKTDKSYRSKRKIRSKRTRAT